MIQLELPMVETYKPVRNSRRKYFNPMQNEKDTARILMLSQKCPGMPLECPTIALFVFGIPSATPKRKKRNLGHLNAFCTKRIDCDNMAKFFCDAMNGIIILDDSLIFSLHCLKIYSEKPKTTIYLWPIVNGEKPLDAHDQMLSVLKSYSPNQPGV